MNDVFSAYAKKALSPAPARLIGVTKTRAEAKVVYTAIVGELRACRSLTELRGCLETRRLEILQIQAEMEFLWFGDGDFLGLEREIEQAFEAVEAATYFSLQNNNLEAVKGSQPATSFHEIPILEIGLESEAGRLPGQQ